MERPPPPPICGSTSDSAQGFYLRRKEPGSERQSRPQAHTESKRHLFTGPITGKTFVLFFFLKNFLFPPKCLFPMQQQQQVCGKPAIWPARRSLPSSRPIWCLVRTKAPGCPAQAFLQPPPAVRSLGPAPREGLVPRRPAAWRPTGDVSGCAELWDSPGAGTHDSHVRAPLTQQFPAAWTAIHKEGPGPRLLRSRSTTFLHNSRELETTPDYLDHGNSHPIKKKTHKTQPCSDWRQCWRPVSFGIKGYPQKHS